MRTPTFFETFRAFALILQATGVSAIIRMPVIRLEAGNRSNVSPISCSTAYRLAAATNTIAATMSSAPETVHAVVCIQ